MKDDILSIPSLSDSPFFDSPEDKRFRNFFRSIDKYSSGDNRVWVLIDQVVRFVKLGIVVPEDILKSFFLIFQCSREMKGLNWPIR